MAATQHANYTEILINSLKCNPKRQELLKKKQDLVVAIEQYHNSSPKSILFYGFSPLILSCVVADISITGVTPATLAYLTQSNIKYTYIDAIELEKTTTKFDWVVAIDEYFTYAANEDEQRLLAQKLTKRAKIAVITTLQDYKNLEFKNREFSSPISIHDHDQVTLYLEHHQSNFIDKNSWTTTVYELDTNKQQMFGPFIRRAMYFKQLAKFSIDAGARQFYIHKNIMYKNTIKRNYEHIISIII